MSWLSLFSTSEPAVTPTPIPELSTAAFNLIITEEVSSQDYYIKNYQHFEYPGGVSGPTIGIGYDCGYVTAEQATQDWKDFADASGLRVITSACGYRGAIAQSWVARYGKSITVPWEAAIGQFKQCEMPKWIKLTAQALPNFELLPPDCQGALVSLAYNRGAGGFTAPASGRNMEMAAIRLHMVQKNFTAIPADLRSMKRLWPTGGDLWRRREHEAVLFEEGLKGKPK